MRALEPVAEFVGGHVDEGVEFAVRFLVLMFLGGMDSGNGEGDILDDGFLVFDHFGGILLPSVMW